MNKINKPKLNQPDVVQSTTSEPNTSITFNNEIDNIPFGKIYSIEKQGISCSKYPLKNYKLNQPIDYLQELKRDVSTKGNLTPFQKICFEHIEKALNQPNPTLEEIKKEWEDDGWKWLDIYTEIYISKDNKQICIDKTYKTISYDCESLRSKQYSLSLTLQEHIRLTKTFIAKGWKVNK